MPVTPTLLLKLRDALGDEATKDLVTWVDHATTRQAAEFRELAELYYSRFDARLEQRLAEVQASLRVEFGREIAALRVEMAAQRREIIKWMCIFWAGTVLPLAGLMVALVKL